MLQPYLVINVIGLIQFGEKLSYILPPLASKNYLLQSISVNQLTLLCVGPDHLSRVSWPCPERSHQHAGGACGQDLPVIAEVVRHAEGVFPYSLDGSPRVAETGGCVGPAIRRLAGQYRSCVTDFEISATATADIPTRPMPQA